MTYRRSLLPALLLIALVSAGCSPKPEPTPTTAPAPTATPTAAMPAEVEMGFTAEGFPYRGKADANVVLVEHSEYQ